MSHQWDDMSPEAEAAWAAKKMIHKGQYSLATLNTYILHGWEL
jgi:hypothetical protein